VLRRLEKADRRGDRAAPLADLPLFAAAPPGEPAAGPDPLAVALDSVNADDLTPKAALDLVYRLKALRRGDGPAS
jgi:DNA mismatch repair protein MutS